MISRLLIEPRDPVLFRDGRAFSAGLSASSLAFPPPSTTVGMMRTILGAPSNYVDLDELNRVAQIGPFLVCSSDDGASWEYALPRPADSVAYEPELPDSVGPVEIVSLSPANLDVESGFLGPVGVPQFLFGAREAKPSTRLPQFWRWAFYEKWLTNPNQCASALPAEIAPPPMGRQKRMHVSISSATQTAEAGLLFATDNLEFLASRRDGHGAKHGQLTRFALVCQFEAPHALAQIPLPQLSILGGESRVVALDPKAAPPLPSCPGSIINSSRVRLILVTPGHFRDGWRPSWLTPDGGSPPGQPGIRLRLVSAAVPRPIPISGWDLAARRPKPSRLLAPAGSTYFCEATGDASALWLKSICEDQAALDGFGIVTLGVW